MFKEGDMVRLKETGIYLEQNAIVKYPILYEGSNELWGYAIKAEINGDMEVPYDCLEVR